MNFFLMLPGAFLAPILHEWVKAKVSAAMGDPVPRNSGFLTWNPLKYFEPIGFFFMLAFGVGWGQPVPTSPMYYKDRRMGTILVHVSPILANLMVGMLVAFFWQMFAPNILWAIYDTPWAASLFINVHWGVRIFAEMNVGLAIFSLIPVFPMAGNKLLQLFVSPTTAMSLTHREKMLQIVMIFLLMFNILQMFIFPIRNFILGLVW